MRPTVVHRPSIIGPKLTQDIAKHLQTRCNVGVAVVVVDKPMAFLSTLRKHWIKLERQLQRDRASTVNPEKIVAITAMLANMYTAKFSASGASGADVYVLPPDSKILAQPIRTVYICTRLSHDQRLAMRNLITDDALVMDFTLSTSL